VLTSRCEIASECGLCCGFRLHRRLCRPVLLLVQALIDAPRTKACLWRWGTRLRLIAPETGLESSVPECDKLEGFENTYDEPSSHDTVTPAE
jgi:hypothetical protein